MDFFITPVFDGIHFSRAIASGLIADLLKEERWEVDEISDRLFKRLLGRKSTRPIDVDTEKELFRRYREGDSVSLNALIMANLRLVNSVARKFRPDKLTCNDLISEGLIGLLKAIDGYDINSYFRFSSYAYKTIYYHIHNFLGTYNLAIAYPSTVVSLRTKYITFYNQYVQEYNSEPTDKDVADGLAITLYHAKGVRQCLEKPVSIEYMCDILGYEVVMEELLDELIVSEPDTIDSSLNYESLLKDIDESLANLYEREADIIRKSFGIGCHPYTLDELGIKYDLTRERTRQIREKAIRKLRGKFGLSLRKYLGDS